MDAIYPSWTDEGLLPQLSIPKVVLLQDNTQGIIQRDNLYQYSPDWKVALMSPKECMDYVRSEYPEYLVRYKEILSSRNDSLARLFFASMWLYDNGGVWIDGYEICGDITTLLAKDGSLYMTIDSNGNVDDGFIACTPRHSLWSSITKSVILSPNHSVPMKLSTFVLSSTHPVTMIPFGAMNALKKISHDATSTVHSSSSWMPDYISKTLNTMNNEERMVILIIFFGGLYLLILLLFIWMMSTRR